MRSLPAVIADGSTTSSIVPLGGRPILGFEVPAGWDGASFTLLHAVTKGGTYLAVVTDAGAAVTITVALSKFAALRADMRSLLSGLGFIKLVANTAQSGNVVTIGVVVE